MELSWFICFFLSSFVLTEAATTQNLKKFSSIVVNGPFLVLVNVGSTSDISIEGSSKVFANVDKKSNRAGTLQIRFNSTADEINPGTITIKVTTKSLSSIVASGSCQLIVQNDFQALHRDLQIATYGSSSVVLQGRLSSSSMSVVTTDASSLIANIAVENLSTVSSGTSAITLTGQADNTNVVATDQSNFHGSNLAVIFLSASAEDRAVLELNADKELKISAHGNAVVKTSGNAKVVKEIRGNAQVQKG